MFGWRFGRLRRGLALDRPRLQQFDLHRDLGGRGRRERFAVARQPQRRERVQHQHDDDRDARAQPVAGQDVTRTGVGRRHRRKRSKVGAVAADRA